MVWGMQSALGAPAHGSAPRGKHSRPYPRFCRPHQRLPVSLAAGCARPFRRSSFRQGLGPFCFAHSIPLTHDGSAGGIDISAHAVTAGVTNPPTRRPCLRFSSPAHRLPVSLADQCALPPYSFVHSYMQGAFAGASLHLSPTSCLPFCDNTHPPNLPF